MLIIFHNFYSIFDHINTALITEINYILTYIHIEYSYFNVNNISQFLQYFWSYKYTALITEINYILTYIP